MFFVNKEFKFSIYCKPIYFGETIVNYDIKDVPDEDYQEIEVYALPKRYKEISRCMENCTVMNHVTGKPMVRRKIFRINIIVNLFKKWNLYSDQKTIIPITQEVVEEMHYNIVKYLVNKYLKITDSKGK